MKLKNLYRFIISHYLREIEISLLLLCEKKKEKKRMDVNKVLLIYKQQLADVMEQRILLQAQVEELLQRIGELEQELEQLKKEQ